MRATRSAIDRARAALGGRYVVWRDGSGREVGRMAEDRAVGLLLDLVLEGARLPDGMARALARAEPGVSDVEAVPVSRAREQMEEEKS